MSANAADRIMEAWVELEGALRNALPVCSVAPPNQPGELLAALRINHRIGEAEEAQILELREIRNRVAHRASDPSEEEAARYESRVQKLVEQLAGGPGSDNGIC